MVKVETTIENSDDVLVVRSGRRSEVGGNDTGTLTTRCLIERRNVPSLPYPLRLSLVHSVTQYKIYNMSEVQYNAFPAINDQTHDDQQIGIQDLSS